MNILEQADKYAEGKANEAITKAIAEAYIEGYKTGYKDREEEIPLELRDNKTKYVDLGLPSRTLWSTDYEKLNGKRLYLPYEKAEYLKLPTKEQWSELLQLCAWLKEADYCYRCIGPNGQTLLFQNTGHIRGLKEFSSQIGCFWLESDTDNKSYKSAAYFTTIDCTRSTSNYFSGFNLPVRLVR